mgnify:CR=1 FL=1
MTTAERRSFDRLLTPGGRLLIVAADQRNGMKAAMSDEPGTVSFDELKQAKYDIAEYLATAAPAVLFDPEVALPGMVDDAALSPSTALVVGMDASGFDTVDGVRYTKYVDGVTARIVRDLGGDVAKMLFYMRADRQGLDSLVAQQIRDLVAECEREGLLLIVEILVYRLEGETEEEYARIFPDLVVDAAAITAACGAKVLKLQYPGSADACARVSAAVPGVPWAVLSAGVDHETFVGQVAEAVAGGARGAMAGRSIWKDSMSVEAGIRRELLVTRARPRVGELQAVLDRT